MILEQLIHSCVLPLFSWIADCCDYCKCDKQSSSQDDENTNTPSNSNKGYATSDSNDDNTPSNSNKGYATSDSNDDNTPSNSNKGYATSDSNDDNTPSNSNKGYATSDFNDDNTPSNSNIGNHISDSNDDNTPSNSNKGYAISDSNDDNTPSNSNIGNHISDSNDDNTPSNSNKGYATSDSNDDNTPSNSNKGYATSDSNDNNTPSNSNKGYATSDSNDDNTPTNSNIGNRISDSNDDNTTSNSNDENASSKFKICLILCTSVVTTSCLLVFAVLITVICGQLVYLDQFTTERCVGAEDLLTNYSTPTSAFRARLIGESYIVFFLNLWYPLTMVLLLGWEKAHISNLVICVITGIIAVIYKVCLYIIFDGDITGWWKRLISSGIVLIGIIITCCRNTSYQASSEVNTIRNFRKKMLLTIGLIFCSATLFAFVYGELLVPWFNNQSSDFLKILVAAIVPLVATIPVAISKYIVLVPLKNTIKVNPSQSYILVYFNHVVPIALYRVMQSDVEHFGYFILFSFLQGLIDNVTKLTRNCRRDLLKKILDWGKITPVPYCEEHNKRLEADIYIQEVLFQFEMLIIAQLYTISYRMDTFQSYSFDRSSLLQLSFGLLMEFIFACLSTSILIWKEDIKIKHILKKHWTRHVLANGLITMTTVLYFSPIIINIYKFGFATAEDVKNLRHCT